MSARNDRSYSRRSILKNGLAGAAATVWAVRMVSAQQGIPHVASSDPMVQSLGYVENAATVNPAVNPTYKAGQTCGSCALAQGGAADKWRPCRMFGGKLVSSAGWCRVWVKQPT